MQAANLTLFRVNCGVFSLHLLHSWCKQSRKLTNKTIQFKKKTRQNAMILLSTNQKGVAICDLCNKNKTTKYFQFFYSTDYGRFEYINVSFSFHLFYALCTSLSHISSIGGHHFFHCSEPSLWNWKSFFQLKHRIDIVRTQMKLPSFVCWRMSSIILHPSMDVSAP